MCFRCVVKKFLEILKKKLQTDGKWYYYYDKEGNLIQKSPCKLHNEKNAQKWSLGVWQYTWNANGSLKSVKKPSGQTISFEYDALGRRTAKRSGNKEILYIWSGNVLLHEIFDNGKEQKTATYVYEQGNFVPTAKLVDNESFSIVSDYIGRPIQVYDQNGDSVWSCDYDIYGKLINLQGDKSFIPFRQLGQYEDTETGLYYNRFRYYDPNSGLYISQDPIGLAGNNPNLYGYVFDSNTEVDIFGLDIHHIIPNEIYKEFRTDFKQIRKDGYIQNISTKAKNKTNLKDNLYKPFHTNHPQYNAYVRERIQELKRNGMFNILEIKKLQDELRGHIDDALNSGMSLNDYFKKGKHKNH